MRDDGRWWEGIVTSTSPLEVRTSRGPPGQGRAMGRVWKQVEKKTVQASSVHYKQGSILLDH